MFCDTRYIKKIKLTEKEKEKKRNEYNVYILDGIEI